jgi:hypothetical protein
MELTGNMPRVSDMSIQEPRVKETLDSMHESMTTTQH